jgi:hypothetical protein
MAITTQDGLIAAIAAGRTVQFQKGTGVAGVSGFFSSRFRDAGMPGAATAPATAAGQTLDRTSVGAMPIPAPSGVTYISSYEGVNGTQPGTLILSDRLVETGALVGNITTAQTVGSVALPTRATGATDVELWLEIYTALGATASAVVTASYTNQAGTSGRTATLVGGIPAGGGLANRTYQLALQAGDTGVMSVQSVTLGTSTGTAGAFGVVLRRTLLTGMCPSAGMGFVQGYAETDLQICPDNACLELLWLHTGASTGTLLGNFGLAQG